MSDEPNGDDGTCAYVARKDDPSNWHGESVHVWQLEEDVWECPHETLDGEDYCAFHTHPDDLPDDVDEGELFVEAVNEASAVEDEETARRKKEFVGATFGAFDIEGAVLDAGDDHPIRFDHAEFTRGVNAENAVFEHPVFASYARFEATEEENSSSIGEISFRDAEFSGDGEVSFLGAEFSGDGDVRFSKAEFSGDGGVSFESAKFSGDGEVSFLGAVFSGDGEVSFLGAVFSGDGRVLFWSTEFSGEDKVSFKYAEFSSSVYFVSGTKAVAYIQRPFEFTDAVFHDELLFLSDVSIEAQPEDEDETDNKKQFRFVFAEPVDFTRAEFPDRMDFSHFRFASDSTFTDAVLRNADFSGADFTGTDEVSEASFDGADLSSADFSDANLRGASLERARLNRAELLGTKLAGAKLYGALLGDARINRETEFWLEDEKHREPDDSALPLRVVRRVKNTVRRRAEPYCAYDPRYRGADGKPDLEKAAEVYGTVETLARDNSLPGLASDCFLGRKDVQLKLYWRDDDTRMIIRSVVPNTVARYGESPLRVLGTGATTIFLCGLAYYAFDLIERTGSDGPVTLFESLYFSALTFTTLGYGDFNPTTQAGQVLAVAETSAGVILLAILVFVFGRRATR